MGGAANTKRWMHGTGHPIRVPVIDLAEVSAGGSSIAWVDPGGALKVGPHSAGADPGPAAYGAGGIHPTVTDADVVLGLARPRRAARRRPEDRPGSGGACDRHGGGTVRPECARRGGAHRRGGEQQHGAGAADRIRGARPRSAGIQPHRVRRGRSGACGRPGRGTGNSRSYHPAGARCVLGTPVSW